LVVGLGFRLQYMKYIIPILFVAALCAGWVIVQLLAKKMKTKNHMDNLGKGGCMTCTCGASEGDVCENDIEDKY